MTQATESSLLDASRLARATYPTYAEGIPAGELVSGKYRLRFASSEADLARVQRLRFEVFNLELDEGLDSAYLLGRDEDEFDAHAHHLLVEEREHGEVVGTYRFMTAAQAAVRGGFYSQTEFDFAPLPAEILARGAEVGRACVSAAHRNGRVIHLLWKGLARYLSWNDKRFLFGCASIPGTDPAIGHILEDALLARGQLHHSIRLEPLPALRCDDRISEAATELAELPPLVQSYLGFGAKVCSRPALDLAFKVIDFFVVLDLQALEPGVRRAFFERNVWSAA